MLSRRILRRTINYRSVGVFEVRNGSAGVIDPWRRFRDGDNLYTWWKIETVRCMYIQLGNYRAIFAHWTWKCWNYEEQHELKVPLATPCVLRPLCLSHGYNKIGDVIKPRYLNGSIQC